MKKLLCLLLMLALMLPMLSACRLRGRKDDAPEATDAQDVSEGEFEPRDGPGYVITDGSDFSEEGPGSGQPTLEPVETLPPAETLAPEDGANTDEDGESTEFATYDEDAVSAAHSEPTPIDSTTYQYSAVLDDNLDYTFNYPSQWENLPGIYTVCFREVVDEGVFPARVAITRKRLVHTPDDATVLSQLTSYMRAIYKQYDASTFQVSTADTDATFMGRHAFSNTYLAYWGETEVKGFIIGCAIERTLYVFHFCASYNEYVRLQNVMQYMMRSVKLK